MLTKNFSAGEKVITTAQMAVEENIKKYIQEKNWTFFGNYFCIIVDEALVKQIKKLPSSVQFNLGITSVKKQREKPTYEITVTKECFQRLNPNEIIPDTKFIEDKLRECLQNTKNYEFKDRWYNVSVDAELGESIRALSTQEKSKMGIGRVYVNSKTPITLSVDGLCALQQQDNKTTNVQKLILIREKLRPYLTNKENWEFNGKWYNLLVDWKLGKLIHDLDLEEKSKMGVLHVHNPKASIILTFEGFNRLKPNHLGNFTHNIGFFPQPSLIPFLPMTTFQTVIPTNNQINLGNRAPINPINLNIIKPKELSQFELLTKNFSLYLAQGKKEAKLLWEEHEVLRNWYSSQEVNIAPSGQPQDKRVIPSNELISIFKDALHGQSAFFIREFWNKNLRIQNWYTGQKMNIAAFGEPVINAVITFFELRDIFKAALRSQFQPFIIALWENNACLRNWYTRNLVNIAPPLHPVQKDLIKFEELDKIFMAAWHSRSNYIIQALWSENFCLQDWYCGKKTASLDALLVVFEYAARSNEISICKAMWQNLSLRDGIQELDIERYKPLHRHILNLKEKNWIVKFQSDYLAWFQTACPHKYSLLSDPTATTPAKPKRKLSTEAENSKAKKQKINTFSSAGGEDHTIKVSSHSVFSENELGFVPFDLEKELNSSFIQEPLFDLPF